MPRRPRKPAKRRPQQARSRATVRVILEAAAQVLLSAGYARATTNRIAEAAGVSIGTLYQYFANKDALFDALVREYFDDVLDAIRMHPVDTSLPLDATIRRLVSAGIDAQRHGPELLRALDQVPNTVFRRRLADGKRQLIAFIVEVLGAYRPVLRVRNLERAATLIVNAAEGIGYHESMASYHGSLADELTTFFVRYLADADGAD